MNYISNSHLSHFPSFRDEWKYGEQKIEFNKRAQLLAANLSYKVGHLSNVDQLTACADYKLPQVLRRHGILQYDEELQRKIRHLKEIPAGSGEEIEIRAHTIYAVELIKEEIKCLTSSQINDLLWLEGQIKMRTDEPYHRTRTIAY